MAKMTKEQRDYLWQRIRKAQEAQEVPWNEEGREPPEVLKAQAVVEKWKAAYQANRERVNATVEKRLIVAKEAYYAGEYNKALEAVKRFESGR